MHCKNWNFSHQTSSIKSNIHLKNSNCSHRVKHNIKTFLIYPQNTYSKTKHIDYFLQRASQVGRYLYKKYASKICFYIIKYLTWDRNALRSLHEMTHLIVLTTDILYICGFNCIIKEHYFLIGNNIMQVI